MRALVFIEHDYEAIDSGTLSTLRAATELADSIDGLVVGNGCQTVQEQAQALPALETVYVADDESLKDFLPENVTPLLQNLADNYDAILMAHSTHGRNIMPRLAALLDLPQVSDIMEIVDKQTYVRPIYAGNANATVRNNAGKQLVTVRTTYFEPVENEGGNASVESLKVESGEQLTRCEGVEVHESDLPDLSTASIVISGGRGVGSKESFQLLEDIAKKMNAAVGASRAAVDAGYVPNDYQVGQTGKIVSPDVYIAVGLSGAIQHLAGMKDSKYIVAINQDPDAPIFQNCDYGLIEDLFTALPAFSKALDNR